VASLWEDPIKVILADPPPHGDATLDFSGDRFWKNYYGAIGGYIRDFRASSDFARPFRGYAFASLEHLPGHHLAPQGLGTLTGIRPKNLLLLPLAAVTSGIAAAMS